MFKASFKGIDFEVTSTDINTGRRTVVHQYPFKDAPFVEDVGKQARTITLDAFFIGFDYIEKAKQLIKVVEEKGSGKLIHPHLGAMQCTCTDRSGISFSDELRKASIKLTFTETGDLEYPSESIATDFVSRISADNLLSSAKTWCESKINLPISITDLQYDVDYISTSLSNDIDVINSVLSHSLFATDLNLNLDLIDKIKNTTQSILAKDFVEGFDNALNIADYASDVHNWKNNTISAAKSVGELETKPSKEPIFDPSEQTASDNRDTVYKYVKLIIISNTIGMSTLIGTAIDKNSENEAFKTTARVDVLSVRESIIKAIDNEIKFHDDNNVIKALRDARHAVWNDLTLRAEKGNALYTKDIKASLPSIVLAYREYGDISRGQEIVDRNNVTNSMFVTGSIKLTK